MGISCKGYGKMRSMMDKLRNAEEKRKEKIKNGKSKPSKKKTD